MILSPSLAKRPGGRVLAIDYGRRRLGLAVSDELGMLARPLPTLERANRRSDMERLSRIKESNGITRIVIGLPLRMDGTPGAMADEARAFGARVAKFLGLPIEMVDERLTSWEAAEGNSRGASAGHKNKGLIDQRAAVLILEEHLRSGHTSRK